MKTIKATKLTAFAAGFSFFAFIRLLGIFPIFDSGFGTILIIFYFFSSALIFVFGYDELRGKNYEIGFLNRPKLTAKNFKLMTIVWLRMLIWFIGVVAFGILAALIE